MNYQSLRKSITKLLQNWECGQKYRRMFICLGLKVGVYALSNIMDSLRLMFELPW